jgi:hypothetical protein
LLDRYKQLLNVTETKFLDQFKDAFVVDGSVIALSKRLEEVFESIHKGHASLKLNTKYSLKLAAVTKLQVTSGKRHDSRFAFVTKEANCLYLVDLGYWSFRLLKKIMGAGSFFVMRLKRNGDPLIVKVSGSELQHLVGDASLKSTIFSPRALPAAKSTWSCNCPKPPTLVSRKMCAWSVCCMKRSGAFM